MAIKFKPDQKTFLSGQCTVVCGDDRVVGVVVLTKGSLVEEVIVVVEAIGTTGFVIVTDFISTIDGVNIATAIIDVAIEHAVHHHGLQVVVF